MKSRFDRERSNKPNVSIIKIGDSLSFYTT